MIPMLAPIIAAFLAGMAGKAGENIGGRLFKKGAGFQPPQMPEPQLDISTALKEYFAPLSGKAGRGPESLYSNPIVLAYLRGGYGGTA